MTPSLKVFVRVHLRCELFRAKSRDYAKQSAFKKIGCKGMSSRVLGKIAKLRSRRKALQVYWSCTRRNLSPGSKLEPRETLLAYVKRSRFRVTNARKRPTRCRRRAVGRLPSAVGLRRRGPPPAMRRQD